jgi:tRNA dimethylallyltransferase
MMVSGLQEEVTGLLQYREHSAFNTVGYQEFIPFFNKESSIDQVVEKIKINTRRYAKRQLTWFRKTSGIIWVKPDLPQIKEVINKILND